MRSGIPQIAARVRQLQRRIDSVNRVPARTASPANVNVRNVNAANLAAPVRSDFDAILQAQLARGALGALTGDEDAVDGTDIFGSLLGDNPTGIGSDLTDLLPRLNGGTGTAILPLGTSIKYNPFRDLEVTSPFGPRDLGGGTEQHNGLDLALPLGTPLPAIGAGKVVSVGEDQVFGRNVVYELDSGEVIRYAHLRVDAPFLVAEGQRIVPGQTVGVSGNTGRSTGPHLHVSVRVNGRFIDPRAYLAALP